MSTERIEGDVAQPEERVDSDADLEDLCAEIADLADRAGLRIATAESLTAGNIAANLGRAPSSGRWFRGGVVAYDTRLKHTLLGVDAELLA